MDDALKKITTNGKITAWDGHGAAIEGKDNKGDLPIFPAKVAPIGRRHGAFSFQKSQTVAPAHDWERR